MKRVHTTRRRRLIWTAFSILGMLISTSVKAEEEATLLHCGRLVDVLTEELVSGQNILVQGNRITAIGANPASPANAKEIDLSNSTCLPGLFETHAHLDADGTGSAYWPGGRSSAASGLVQLRQAQEALKNGFTTIRSVGEFTYHPSIIDVKRAINHGDFVGPRIYVAPNMWSATGGHGDYNIVPTDGPTKDAGFTVPAGTGNVREKVREEIKLGADWIKIAASGGVMSSEDDVSVSGFTQQELNTWVDETHRYHKKITAHVHGNKPAYMAVKAGVDALEHGTMIEDDTISLLKKQGTWLVPTTWVVDEIARLCNEPN